MGYPIVDGSAAGLQKSGHLPSICPRPRQTQLPTWSLARIELVQGLGETPYQNLRERSKENLPEDELR